MPQPDLIYKPLDPTRFNFVEDFETAGFQQRWSWRDLPFPSSMVQDSNFKREQNFGCKVTLNKTDPLVSNNHRAELVWNSQAYNTQTKTGCRHICYSVFIPTDWIDDTGHPESIINIHDGEPCANRGTNPQALAIQTYSDGKSHFFYWIYSMTDNNYCSGGTIQSGATRQFDLGVIEKGRWYDFVVESNWDYSSGGYVNVWKDGVKVLSKAGISVWYKGCFTEPYVKIGLYKYSWTNETAWGGNSKTTQRIFYIDRVRFGNLTTLAEDVLPIQALPPNQAPVAKLISPDQTIALPTVTAMVQATATDVDGSIAKRQWTITRKPTGSNATLSGSDQDTAILKVDLPGLYSVDYQATDDKGAVSNFVQTSVNVLEPPYLSGISIAEGTPKGIVATLTYSDGTIAVYR